MRGTCTLPPDSYYCTLEANHEGPCPTVSDPGSLELALTALALEVPAAVHLDIVNRVRPYVELARQAAQLPSWNAPSARLRNKAREVLGA